jgi:hypothetical protein
MKPDPLRDLSPRVRLRKSLESESGGRVVDEPGKQPITRRPAPQVLDQRFDEDSITAPDVGAMFIFFTPSPSTIRRLNALPHWPHLSGLITHCKILP